MSETPTVKIGDAVVHEVLHAHELQHLLRQVGPNLSGAVVTTPSEIEPWMVNVAGALMIYGEAHYWETPIDMRGVKSAEDIIQLAGALEASFEKAASQLSRPA